MRPVPPVPVRARVLSLRFAPRAVLALAIGVFACVASPAMALNPERHYELVSPPFKAGFGVNADLPIAVAEDGEAVAFSSNGVFDGAPAGLSFGPAYLARRGASSWETTPVVPPLSLIAEPASGGYDVTSSLDRVLRIGRPGPEVEQAASEQDLFTHDTRLPDVPGEWERDAVLELANGKQEKFLPQYLSADAGLCLAVLSSGGPEPLVPEAIQPGVRELYQVGLGCGGHTEPLQLVGLNNRSKLISQCGVVLGSSTDTVVGRYSRTGIDSFNAVSADGSEVFFTACTSGRGEASEELPHQLFVRLGGSRTLEVSRPVGEPCEAEGAMGEVPCDGAQQRASADFQGASEDGSRVYFTAPLARGQGPLVAGDEDPSQNLYLAKIGCPPGDPACGAGERVVNSLVEASHDPNTGQAAEVMGVARVAPDGSRAYFVAGGDLLTAARREALQREGAPVPQLGAANLYVFDEASGATQFVAELCSGTGLSGAVEDARCPSESDEQMWTHSPPGSLAQTAGAHGEFLLFDSYGQLTGDDTNRASDVYRYDSQSGRLSRVSFGENGFDDNGNRTVLDAKGKPLGAQIPTGEDASNNSSSLMAQDGLITRAISEDGKRVVFGSAEPLSPMATNGLENAYEWHASPGGGEGSVSLVSSGSSAQAVLSEDVRISPSGRDVFFVTSQSLVPQDADEFFDVYDARTEQGFPATEAPTQPCSGDACQGPLTNPAPLLVPGSVSQAPGENLSTPASGGVKPGLKAKPRKARCRRGLVKRRGKCVHRPRARKPSDKRRAR